ncbi:MAG: succinylglutamate desuccinylase/aspartoacylase family protein [bacterium]
MRYYSRRTFLAASVSSVAAVACGGSAGAGQQRAQVVPGLARDEPEATPPAPATPTFAPTPTSTPMPKGSEQRTLLAGTASETRMVIRHSGVSGPAVMILGGVHGNEPGGWLAADEVATWEPAIGSLIVVPRSNAQAIASFVRTFDEIGDLNRLYPGRPDSPLLMEQLAWSFLETCREFHVELLLDMHESWAFYAEYPPNSGTGALGQTITAGPGAKQADFAQQIAEIVNPQASPREQFIVRDGTRLGATTATPALGQASRGRSSLAAGAAVPGLTPILVEMGQEDQPLDRRIQLHLITARAVLQLGGLIS